MNYKYYIVADFETDSPDCETTNPVELAAVAIHPRTLEIFTEDAFKMTIKPPSMDDDDYYTDERNKTIKWHADTRGTTTASIIDMWQNGTSEEMVWKNFLTFLQKYHIRKNVSKKIYYTEPIISGYNIDGFDIPIFKRLAAKYKTKKWPFSKLPPSLDLQAILYYWFDNMPEPDNMKLDTLKKYFGLESSGQAHEALSDVIDTAKILVRFLKFARSQANYDKFNNSFK